MQESELKNSFMKRDIIFIFCVAVFLSPFIFIPQVMNGYLWMNGHHPFAMAALKFAILATLGEVIGLRIRTGAYHKPGFGILPRAIVWAFLGICIKAAFVIFAKGAPGILTTLGVDQNWNQLLGKSIFETRSWWHVLAAFTISATMNTFFAPVFMTFHKITDTHIEQTGGTIHGIFSPVKPGKILKSINWDVQWNFVFLKTIPLFWIPAHTITFMLPPQHRILFAAILGVVLGVILSIASLKGKQ